MRKGEELKTPRYASAAALRNDCLPHSRQLEILVFSISILLKSLFADLIFPLAAFFKVYYITKYSFKLRILLRR